MFRKAIIFLCMGFVWLFLFSMPVGQGRNLFSVAHYYIVDTRPVYWMIDKIRRGADATSDAASGTRDRILQQMDGRLSQNSGSARRTDIE